ncbi:unnamed protein product, partial [Symbiodinium sp. KB8]
MGGGRRKQAWADESQGWGSQQQKWQLWEGSWSASPKHGTKYPQGLRYDQFLTKGQGKGGKSQPGFPPEDTTSEPSGNHGALKDIQKVLSQARRSDTRVRKLMEEEEFKKRQWKAFEDYSRKAFIKQKKSYEADLARIAEEKSQAETLGRQAAQSVYGIVLRGTQEETVEEAPAGRDAWDNLWETEAEEPEVSDTGFFAGALAAAREAASHAAGPAETPPGRMVRVRPMSPAAEVPASAYGPPPVADPYMSTPSATMPTPPGHAHPGEAFGPAPRPRPGGHANAQRLPVKHGPQAAVRTTPPPGGALEARLQARRAAMTGEAPTPTSGEGSAMRPFHGGHGPPPVIPPPGPPGLENPVPATGPGPGLRPNIVEDNEAGGLSPFESDSLAAFMELWPVFQ